MRLIIYWFRNDLRLVDNPGFTQACSDADLLLPIFIHDTKNDVCNPLGIKRMGQQRRQFQNESIDDLKEQLQQAGSDLMIFSGNPSEVISEIVQQLSNAVLYTQKIEAPEENYVTQGLREAGVVVKEIWQSSMLDPADLPFSLEHMPDVFTQFRQAVEKAKLKYALPIEQPSSVPGLPNTFPDNSISLADSDVTIKLPFKGGSKHALMHIDQYFERRLPDSYKQTRNQLMGMDYSSKFSPWLALGCCSARSIAHRLNSYEQEHGSNEGTYWLWFELLWRDYFEFLPFKYGKRLFAARGLSKKPNTEFDTHRFYEWIEGETSDLFINAGMRELSQTGYVSNRMRQIIASYWVYNMNGDWRAGASWFESQLIDYDVYSNQGNWLYIAGLGTDPRGGRPFNIVKQAQLYDSEKIYQNHWLSCEFES